MPTAPPHPCAGPSCSTLLPMGQRYCDPCRFKAGAQDRAVRGSARQRGYDARWEKARLHYLRAHPLCVACERTGPPKGDIRPAGVPCVTPATVVDHIVPHKGDPALFWDERNWQALCESHHNAKTAGQDRGAWRPQANRPMPLPSPLAHHAGVTDVGDDKGTPGGGSISGENAFADRAPGERAKCQQRVFQGSAPDWASGGFSGHAARALTPDDSRGGGK